MALYAASERFFASHLEGRFQKGGTPEAPRGSEITVDPVSVGRARVIDVSQIGAPTPARELRTGGET